MNIIENAIPEYLKSVEADFRAEGKDVPPTELMMAVLVKHLQELHPNFFLPSYGFRDDEVLAGFDDDGSFKILFPPNRCLPFTENHIALRFCKCGETPLLVGSRSDENGLRMMVAVVSKDCEHGHMARKEVSKPASKKRRKRDASKQAA